MKVEERVLEIINLMSQGIPYSHIKMPLKRSLKTSVAQKLGLDPARFNLGSYLDPRLVKIALKILQEPKLSDAQIGKHFGEPVLLIARTRESMMRQPYGSKWLKGKSELRQSWFYQSSINAGLVSESELSKLGRYYWVQDLHLMRKMSPGVVRWKSVSEKSAQLTACENCGSFRRSTSRLFEPVGMVCMDCHIDEAGLLWPSDPYDQWLDITKL
jgi:hypothetical protein